MPNRIRSSGRGNVPSSIENDWPSTPPCRQSMPERAEVDHQLSELPTDQARVLGRIGLLGGLAMLRTIGGRRAVSCRNVKFRLWCTSIKPAKLIL